MVKLISLYRHSDSYGKGFYAVDAEQNNDSLEGPFVVFYLLSDSAVGHSSVLLKGLFYLNEHEMLGEVDLTIEEIEAMSYEEGMKLIEKPSKKTSEKRIQITVLNDGAIYVQCGDEHTLLGYYEDGLGKWATCDTVIGHSRYKQERFTGDWRKAAFELLPPRTQEVLSFVEFA